jgi:SRSO17 transposase
MAVKMGHGAQSSEARFAEYIDSLAAVLGRDDRAQPLKDYCTGPLMPGERDYEELKIPAELLAIVRSLIHC